MKLSTDAKKVYWAIKSKISITEVECSTDTGLSITDVLECFNILESKRLIKISHKYIHTVATIAD